MTPTIQADRMARQLEGLNQQRLDTLISLAMGAEDTLNANPMYSRLLGPDALAVITMLYAHLHQVATEASKPVEDAPEAIREANARAQATLAESNDLLRRIDCPDPNPEERHLTINDLIDMSGDDDLDELVSPV